MEISYPILWYSLFKKLDDGSASVMRRRHLVSNHGQTIREFTTSQKSFEELAKRTEIPPFTHLFVEFAQLYGGLPYLNLVSI